MRTGTLTQRMRSGYLIIARMLSSSPSAFAARSKFSSATSYAFIGFVAVANMANLQYQPHGSPKSGTTSRGCCVICGTDDRFLSSVNILAFPRLTDHKNRWSVLHFQHNPPHRQPRGAL